MQREDRNINEGCGSFGEAKGPVFHPGEAFHGYVIEKQIGQGGLGSIWLGRHHMLETLFAIKVLDPEVAEAKVRELEDALWKASEEGEYPVLCDQSPCLHRMRRVITGMKLYEPAEFIMTYLVHRLQFHPSDLPIALHLTCSTREMGADKYLIALARLCSTRVCLPEGVGCCGFAGDKGFIHPELNRYALRKLRPQLLANHIQAGYSNSRTCEIGLQANTGIPYMSIVYLVNACTSSKQQY